MSLILSKGFWRVIVTRLSVSFSFALSNSVNNGYEVAILEICLCDVTFRQGIDLVAESTVRNEQLSFDVDPRVGLFLKHGHNNTNVSGVEIVPKTREEHEEQVVWPNVDE